ncbi:hypothetical protein [Mycobacterium paragordonae]|uniref:DUF222 domain-containing protein n=1 Tax=Mycobacterium paragordonae TaxID=1389713 RepID=A0AAJ1SDK7_9MYCO|nr:hypothetical protein [Mycobacterium paragordonae]MDP7739469.1 hypothetical protein [Mycobacterium paragordonae]PJE23838.1 MAG: hypothetical protein CK431_09140 [Mycobacterium sp.]
MADDELDALYWVPPDQFTAERKKLSAAAKERGDAAGAKRISAARKPTTAAWIVNRLAIGHRQTQTRLAELGDSLRTAHAAMDAVQIRELSARQHHLISELTAAAFDAAEVKSPSSTVRDDIASTLQAAIADPEVRARLGRLVKAERWSGFGDVGNSAVVSSTTGPKRTAPTAKPSPSKAPPRDEQAEAAKREREKLTAAVAGAEQAAARADSVLADRRAKRDAARTRRDQAAAVLSKAERAAAAAENN